MEENNTRPSQCIRVVDYMKTFGSITSAQAFIDLGVMHLPKRISELRQRGVLIDDEFISVTNRYGEPCRVKKYSLRSEIL